LPDLEHQLTIEPEARIHTYNILKKEEMLFMYAPGAKANPPKIQNFHPKLNILHRLLRATLAPRIGDATACPQYERNLIQYYYEKKPFLSLTISLWRFSTSQRLLSAAMVMPHRS
jgi:hypothetical protein